MEQNNGKLEGTINTTVGTIKETAGKALGNPDLQAEGAVQKNQGQAQKFSGAVKDAVKKGKTMLGIKSKRF